MALNRLFIITSVLFFFTACRFTTDMSLLNAPRETPQAKAAKRKQQAADREYALLRWFPIDTAKGYRLDLESPSGTLVHSEQVLPSGCTHRSREGYTSGVCALRYKLPKLSEEYVIRIRTIGKNGRLSPPSQQLKPH